MKFKALVSDEQAMSRAIKRLAHEIIEKNDNLSNLCIIGIKTRGVPFGERLCRCIEEIENVKIPFSLLDITLYRDDLSFVNKNKDAVVSETKIDFDLNNKNIIIADDVIYTGRTARAALEAVLKYGRPSKIQLAVMVDRGHRELPIRPDFVGKNVPTSKTEVVHVSLAETDGKDSIEIFES